MKTVIVGADDRDAEPLYDGALEHIRRSYCTAFSADTDIRPARLVVTLARSGQIACAAGIRCHDEGFFSQQYLDEPVSDVIARKTGGDMGPRDILEVGGLACSTPFAAYPTLRAVFEWGRERRIGWGLFTATAEVRRLIQRSKIAPLMLARAEAARVCDPARWGSYYEHDPWVCAFRDPSQGQGPVIPHAESA
ncbi:thermostable hemolysin [Roseovarius bejariae]|nr:thermostable hemolysin [Roseovarius bejariae]